MHTIVCFYSAFYRPLFPITLSLSLTLSLCHSHSLCLSFTVTVFAAETGNQTRRNDLKLKTKKKKKNEIKVSQLQKSMDQEYLHEASEHWCRALIKIEFSSLSHVLCGLFRLVFVFFLLCSVSADMHGFQWNIYFLLQSIDISLHFCSYVDGFIRGG